MRPPHSSLLSVLRVTTLLAGALVVLFPYAFMVATSLKPQSEVFAAGLKLIPDTWAMVPNYTKAMTRIPLARILLNGVIVCVSIQFFQVLFAIFSVVAHWNDLYWPLIAISKTDLATPPLGLLFFRAAEAGDDYGALMAATVLITLPLILFFCLPRGSSSRA